MADHEHLTRPSDDDDDDDDNIINNNDGLTLRQVAARACKRVDIGAAVLPKPLFQADLTVSVDDYTNGQEELADAAMTVMANALNQQANNNNNNNGNNGGGGNGSSKGGGASTHYARLLQKEFNAVVVEHHLKWAPLLLPKTTEGGRPGSTSNSLSGIPSATSPAVAGGIGGTSSTRSLSSGGGGGGSTRSLNNPGSFHGDPRRASSGQPPAKDPPGLDLHKYDFTHADAIVDWALERHMKVKGHVLVWHVTSPKCLHDMEPDAVRRALRRHIYTVMGHYRGRIRVWDVVNESLAPDGSLADNVFMQKLGPSYIEDSFRWAHEADPSATLLYNDNKVESVDSRKGRGFYELLADLKAKGVPVHGCGMQAHFNAAGVGVNTCPTPRQVKQQIRRLGQLGLTVNISEMDVRVSQLEPKHLRDMAQKQIYHDVLAAALSEPAFDGIWLWGVSDRHTWVTHFYYDDEPLVFDESYARKEAYYGLRDALASLTPAGRVGGEGVLLDSDVDVNGNTWGHLWNRGGGELLADAEGKVQAVSDATGGRGEGGDARPDWEQEDDLPETDNEGDDDDDNSGIVSGTDNDSGDDEPVELTKRVGLPEIS